MASPAMKRSGKLRPSTTRRIVLHDGGSARAGEARSHASTLAGGVLVSWALLGALALGFGACASMEDGAAFCVSSAVVALALHVLSAYYPTKAHARMAFAAVVTASLAAVAVLPLAQLGLCAFGNELIARFDEAFSAYVPLLSMPESGGSGAAFFAAAGALSAAVVWLLVERRSTLTITLLAFSLQALALSLHAGASPASLALTLAAWLAAWRLSLMGPGAGVRPVLSAAFAALAVACAALALGLSYQPDGAVDRFREALVEDVEAARFGDDSLPEGDLAEARFMKEGEGERLKLAFDTVPDNELYLRGFVGARFEDGAWSALDHTAYEGSWKGAFSWFGSQGFAPCEQLALLSDEGAARGVDAPHAVSIEVEAVGADRAYVYVPASLRSVEGARLIDGRDGSLLAAGPLGARSYVIEEDDVVAAAEIAETPAWVSEGGGADGYAASESVYRSFAAEHYLDLSEQDRALVERLFFGDETWDDGEEMTTAAVISRVRAMLETLASYVDVPDAPPSKAPFLSWFLEEEHEGNAAYFATAATLAFRAQGIPARYVEGYRADDGALDLVRASGGREAILDAGDAHAWVEVYLDGVGWSPVEVTPGFYEQPLSVSEVIEVSRQMAGDEDAGAQQTGALGGRLEEEGPAENGQGPLSVAIGVLAGAGALAASVCCALIALEARRAALRARRAKRCASDVQAVSVPALYDQMAAIVHSAGVPLVPERPHAASSAFSAAFPGITADEYRRAVDLVQKSVFGCMELRPHEMRALRSFNERLRREAPPARGVRAVLERRYRFAV